MVDRRCQVDSAVPRARSVAASAPAPAALQHTSGDLDVAADRPEEAPQRRPSFHDTTWGRPRARLGWSLRQLAAASGINAGELSRIERGKSCPTFEQASILVDVFRAAR
jgi:ribosome-binding protein aMBF1 (putative translation factor)